MIHVAPLGPGSADLLTQETVKLLRSGLPLILRTEKHGVTAWLTSEQISFTSLDDFYDRFDDFDEMHHAMACRLTELAKDQDIIYAVPDPSTDASVFSLLNLTEDVHILSGVSLAGYWLSRLPAGFPRCESVRTASASILPDPSSDSALLITELSSREIAGEVKLCLMDIYPDTLSVVLLTEEKAEILPLYSMDRGENYDHLTALYVPAIPFEERTRFQVEDLKKIMGILRSPDGCPWDRVQTHRSLRKYIIEEAYEAAGAIDEDDTDHLAEELGDVLFQVIFHASIGEDAGEFSLTDIATLICQKMIRRHPHVFLKDSDRGPESWEDLKKEEKGFTSLSESLEDVTPALPALTRAVKILSRTYKTLKARPEETVYEELKSLTDDLETSSDRAETLGRVLLVISELCRILELDPEEILHQAADAHIRAIKNLEIFANKDKKSLKTLTEQEISVYLRMVSGHGRA